ncbi:hypothetical protein LCGC14_1991050, partial [marine sediment metagenome]
MGTPLLIFIAGTHCRWPGIRVRAVTTPSAEADGFSGNARPNGPRYLPKAQS